MPTDFKVVSVKDKFDASNTIILNIKSPEGEENPFYFGGEFMDAEPGDTVRVQGIETEEIMGFEGGERLIDPELIKPTQGA